MGYHGYPVKKEPTIPCPFKSSYRRLNKHFEQEDYLEEGAALVNTLAQIYLQNMKTVHAHPLSNNENIMISPLSALGQEQGILQSLREEIGK